MHAAVTELIIGMKIAPPPPKSLHYVILYLTALYSGAYLHIAVCIKVHGHLNGPLNLTQV